MKTTSSFARSILATVIPIWFMRRQIPVRPRPSNVSRGIPKAAQMESVRRCGNQVIQTELPPGKAVVTTQSPATNEYFSEREQ